MKIAIQQWIMSYDSYFDMKHNRDFVSFNFSCRMNHGSPHFSDWEVFAVLLILLDAAWSICYIFTTHISYLLDDYKCMIQSLPLNYAPSLSDDYKCDFTVAICIWIICITSTFSYNVDIPTWMTPFAIYLCCKAFIFQRLNLLWGPSNVEFANQDISVR